MNNFICRNKYPGKKMCERNFPYILHASMYMLCENFAINLLTWENSRITSVFFFSYFNQTYSDIHYNASRLFHRNFRWKTTSKIHNLFYFKCSLNDEFLSVFFFFSICLDFRKEINFCFIINFKFESFEKSVELSEKDSFCDQRERK